MQIAQTFASKAIVAAVATAMVFSAFTAPAKAQSVEDLQKMINDLMAQISALQGGTTTTTGAGVCPYTWTRDLKTGAVGADVMTLQKFLNANADTRVAATGAGSAGMETQTFGPATAAAVSKFQVMYRADILTPAGLTNPTGYFGPSTRAKANALCAVATTPATTTPATTTTPSTSDLSGEADFDEATLDSASDDTVEEGQSDAEIAELTVSFVDGDASISRLDVSVSSTSVDSWDVLDTVSLWVDGKQVAEMDASDNDNYQTDDITLRFNGLNIVANEDEDTVITVAATFQDGIDSTDLGDFAVDIEGMRYFDADGVADTLTDGDIAVSPVTFTLEEAGGNDEIVVKAATSDPDATTLKLKDDAKSDWYEVFAFDIDTDDSVNDIDLNEVPVTVTLSSSTYGTMIDDAELVIDGTTIDDVDVSDAATANPVLTFNVDGDVTVDAGDRVTAVLKLRFKSLTNSALEGTTVTGAVYASNTNAIDAEGADTLDNSSPDQLTGSATGEAHTLRTTGIDVDSTPTMSAVVTNGDNAGDDYATFKITLDVTAFDQDVFVSTNYATSVSVSVKDSAGSTVTGTSTIVLESSADIEGGSYKINEGESETVTVTVTFDAATAGAAARLQLNSLTFGATDGANNQTWSALPATTFRTAVVTLVN